MPVYVGNESGREVDATALVALSRHVLDAMGVAPLADLSVLLVDIDTMAQLHERWMGEPGPTDVLAFPMDELEEHGGHGSTGPDDAEDAPVLLGDVVLCPEVAARHAREVGHRVEDELELLCTHGILHLLGYDHGEPEEHREMFGLQDRLLAGWRDARAAGAVWGARSGRVEQP